MIYSNDDPRAISAMEIARTGNYGEYDYDDSPIICPICNEEVEVLYKNIFNNEIVGCTYNSSRTPEETGKDNHKSSSYALPVLWHHLPGSPAGHHL